MTSLNTLFSLSLMSNTREQLSPTETAKLLRAGLRRAFPGVKFRVYKSSGSWDTYNVRWTDGPATDAVQSAFGHFKGTSFDGMTDSTIHTRNTVECADGVRRESGIGYLFFERDTSPEALDAQVAALVEMGAVGLFETSLRCAARSIECGCSRAQAFDLHHVAWRHDAEAQGWRSMHTK